ncbi:MAG TPA: zf-HC2 domain-containing protein [Planctomycetota bacterium]|nr:zf-HC2 domain-containing protein [Planctomycetota bacterium]
MIKDEVGTQLSAYLDGELGEAERRAVEAALSADAALRAELDQLRRTAELVRALPRRAAPAGLAPRVRRAIAVAQRPSRPWLGGWRAAALAAAACLLFGITLLLTHRPDRTREVARDVTPLREHSKGEPEHAAPAEALRAAGDVAARGRSSTRAEANGVDKLEADKELLARANDEAAARRKAFGYGDLSEAPRPALAEAKTGSDGRSVAPGLVKKAEAFAEGERAPADDGRKDLKVAEPAAPRPTAAPAAEVAKEETAKQDLDGYANAGELRKAGKASSEAAAALAGEKRRAADRQELLDEIARERRFAQSAPHRAVGAAGGQAANSAAERRIERRLAYTDLARCLAEAQATLDAASLAYAVQPVGGGQFVIETRLPEPEARALLARLTEPAKDKGWEKGEQPQAGQPREAQRPDALVVAKDAPPPTVHLVLRFVRVEGVPAAGPAEQKR